MGDGSKVVAFTVEDVRKAAELMALNNVEPHTCSACGTRGYLVLIEAPRFDQVLGIRCSDCGHVDPAGAVVTAYLWGNCLPKGAGR